MSLGNAHTAQAITANGQTIVPNGSYNPVTTGAAFTGLILTPGTSDGQIVIIANIAAVGSGFQLTFDVPGTSNVADGTNCIIRAADATLFVWDSSTSLWYKCLSP